MKRMKKLFVAALAAVMIGLLVAGCAAAGPAEPVKVGALKGPTGMGIAPLMEEKYASDYAVSLFSAPDDAVAAFISGDVSIAAVPVNLASTLYKKLEGDVRIIGVNTLGVLYVLEAGDTVHAVTDLAGKTVYATGQASTPEYVLAYLIDKAGIADSVTVEFKAEHSELAALMASGEVTLGMLPEPNVTAAMTKNANLRIALDLSDEWKAATGSELVQGVFIVRAKWYDGHKKDVSAFLKDYADAVKFVNESPAEAAAVIANHEILSAAAIAERAIPNCNIVLMTGADMKAAVKAMFDVLYAANPASIGGALPADDIYVG